MCACYKGYVMYSSPSTVYYLLHSTRRWYGNVRKNKAPISSMIRAQPSDECDECTEPQDLKQVNNVSRTQHSPPPVARDLLRCALNGRPSEQLELISVICVNHRRPIQRAIHSNYVILHKPYLVIFAGRVQ